MVCNQVLEPWFWLAVLCATSLLTASVVKPSLLNEELMALLRDDNHSTCAVFDPLLTAPWHFDFSLKLFYITKPETVSVSLVGSNIGCSSADDSKLYIFPISSWNESSGFFGARKTCKFQESSVVAETGLQRCAYRCSLSGDSIALRLIRIPQTVNQTTWSLCDVSNLFYENPACNRDISGVTSGSPRSTRDCWIAGGRRPVTGLRFYVGTFLYGVSLFYGDTTCTYGNMHLSGKKITRTFAQGEIIKEVILYRDTNKKYTNYRTVVGLKFVTNCGNTYYAGVQDVKSYRFSGYDLLYLHGRVGMYMDSLGVQFGKC